MRNSLFLTLVGLMWSTSMFAQEIIQENEITQQIRELELEESLAVLGQDMETLDKIWATDFMVNNPGYQVIQGKSAVFERMRGGIIHYESFTRDIEAIKEIGDLVIVMGLETVVPTGEAPSAGRTVLRRYTNIWKYQEGKWQVIARHANIICQN
ncbi:nuclear transport factor 2 family protein [Pararhodonellum marinum]|uniref:nuclear transport factor 2 family protein n=1 Tax=Pararhodonellum marinum TaxID=2755358 RepID=UPI00188F0958|nr:nuclear transport factor 2 family protein [Pararhodonellum marinum]